MEILLSVIISLMFGFFIGFWFCFFHLAKSNKKYKDQKLNKPYKQSVSVFHWFLAPDCNSYHIFEAKNLKRALINFSDFIGTKKYWIQINGFKVELTPGVIHELPYLSVEKDYFDNHHLLINIEKIKELYTDNVHVALEVENYNTHQVEIKIVEVFNGNF